MAKPRVNLSATAYRLLAEESMKRRTEKHDRWAMSNIASDLIEKYANEEFKNE